MFRAFEVARKIRIVFAHKSTQTRVVLNRCKVYVYAQGGFLERIPYQPLEPSMLKEEAEYLADKLRKQAAGRPFEMMHLNGYYEEKQTELDALKPKI